MSRFEFYSRGVRQELVSEDDYSELWQDGEGGLAYVALRGEGLRRIAQDYKKRKGIDIEVVEYRSTSRDHCYDRGTTSSHRIESIVSAISTSLSSLGVGASKGLVYLLRNRNGYVMHAMPFLLQRGHDGVARVLDFEEILVGGASAEFSTIPVVGYRGMQKDNHSCTVFSIDTLKNCLTDERFLSQISTTTGGVEVPKMFLAQGRAAYERRLTAEKAGKYLDGTVNRKALYKGHHYARFLDATHKRFLDRSTKRVVEAIDEKRIESAAPTTSPVLERKTEIYDPQVTLERSAFFGTQRGNKFRAEAGHDEKSFKKIFIKNLADAAAEFGMDARQVLQAIEVARIRGGIANAFRGGGDLPDGVDEMMMKRFSARVQTLNQHSGIRSARKAELGLRLCYTPESVTENEVDFAVSFNSSLRAREGRSR